MCSSELDDEELALAFVASREVVAQTDDCIATQGRSANTTGYVTADLVDIGDVTVVSDDGGFALTQGEEFWEGCVTSTRALEYGTSHQLTSNGSVELDFLLSIPGDPELVCVEPVVGEPAAINWTSQGADSAGVRISWGSEFNIFCEVPDTGLFTVPSELTALAPDGFTAIVQLELSNSEEIWLDEDTWMIARATAAQDCLRR